MDEKWNSPDECYNELMNAIVIQAVVDWKTAWKKLQKLPNCMSAQYLKCDAENFFHSDWYKQLCQYPAKDLLAKLPGMAKIELYEETLRKWITAYKTTITIKPGTKTNDKKIKNAERRMKEVEEDFWSKWFLNLYRKHPEDLIEECREQAKKEIAEEAERKRLAEEAKKAAKKKGKSVQKCTKVCKSVQK